MENEAEIERDGGGGGEGQGGEGEGRRTGEDADERLGEFRRQQTFGQLAEILFEQVSDVVRLQALKVDGVCNGRRGVRGGVKGGDDGGVGGTHCTHPVTCNSLFSYMQLVTCNA